MTTGLDTGLSTEAALNFLRTQLAKWPLAAANFAVLSQIQTRQIRCNGRDFTIQHNPARITSTGATVTKSAIAARPCFLCAGNRPTAQISLSISGGYELLVNPYPIFPVHFTIPACLHTPQLIAAEGGKRFADMLRIAGQLPTLALFYNGARCGASAPDHFHFQAVEACRMPLLQWVADGAPLPYRTEHATFTDPNEALNWFNHIMAGLQPAPTEDAPEAPVNIICAAGTDGGITVCIIPRKAHRPDFYGSGEGQILVSPASVDLAGTIILPRPADFNENFTSARLADTINQTCFT